jgi:hypothetical protein
MIMADVRWFWIGMASPLRRGLVVPFYYAGSIMIAGDTTWLGQRGSLNMAAGARKRLVMWHLADDLGGCPLVLDSHG